MQTLGKPAPSFLPAVNNVEWINLAIQEVIPLCEKLEVEIYSEKKCAFLFSSVAVFELFSDFDFKSFLKDQEVWVVGQKTLERLTSFGVSPVYFGNTLKELLSGVKPLSNELCMVHFCSSKTRAVPDVFKKLGVDLINVKVYEPKKLDFNHETVKISADKILNLEWVILYSSSQVDAFFDLWSELIFLRLSQGELKFLCLGESALNALKLKSISEESFEMIGDRPIEWAEKLKARINQIKA